MKGTERGPNNTLRYFYQYKVGGQKYYYKKNDLSSLRLPFRKPFIPNPPKYNDYIPPHDDYTEYVPTYTPKLTKLESEFQKMHPNIQTLITTWLLIMGFAKLEDINIPDVNQSFRKLSLIHHPDRGGSEEKFQQLGSVRDHLITLCTMANVMNV